ncbi:hypothetical protein KFK09_018109 [Dendrobium nobile]|uniref:NAC domain-containing protein n=1 Tax=Dendrobium nobile TaxID=94219 RepID=A0A8T3AUW7_DENNO|nr:hypothetical protein KFK09_018109 [Dendrobium nobile]
MATLEVLPLESLPLGFRFRPTDEELLSHYLKRKINGRIKADRAVIPEVDVCKYEPWDLPEKSIIKSRDPEWFFFAPKDLKYRNGKRFKRATEAGFWKATGKDRPIRTRALPMAIGMKKTLVFYLGRAPKGKRTGWIIHEYRTVEPEFDKGCFVLCKLYKKPEEKIGTSNADKIDGSILSPDIISSSPDTTAQGDDALYETTPLHQEIVTVNWPETVDESMTKSEETYSYSDMTADIGASDIYMDNLKDDPGPSNLSSLNLGFEQNDSDLFYYNSPLDMSLHFDDDDVGAFLKDDDDEVAKLLDSILLSDEECLPELNQFLGNTSEAVPSTQVGPFKQEAFLDNTSGIDIIIGNNADVEVLLPQDAPGLAASYQMSGSINPSSHFMPLTSNSYNVLGPQFDSFIKNSTANELQSMASFNGNAMFEGLEASETLLSVADLSQDLFKNEPNPSGEDNSTGIGIKLRPPRKRTSANPNQLGSQGMAAHGNAFRRIRLQTSLRVGAAALTNQNSSSSNGDHDDKADISESGNNAEFEIPKMAYCGPSDNDDNEKKEVPKAASINFGRVTVVLPVILCVLCIGIGWFFSYR